MKTPSFSAAAPSEINTFDSETHRQTPAERYLSTLGTLLAVCTFASFFLIAEKPGSWNDLSRLATVQALVEHGTLAIDKALFGYFTHDKVFINGHYYSDKPPFPSLIAAVVYYPLYLAGLKLGTDKVAHIIVVATTIKLSLFIGLFYFYRSLGHCDLPHSNRQVLTGALAVSTLILPWSSVFNNHILAAAYLMIGFYYYLESNAAPSKRSNYLISGLFFGLAGVSDIPTMIFAALFGLLIIIDRKRQHNIATFALFPTALMLIYLIINHQISGSILPVQINGAHFDYPGSPWADLPISGIETASVYSTVEIGIWYLFGPNGFMLYNPLLFVAAPCLILTITTKHPLWREASAIAAGIAIIMIYYFSTSEDEGAYSYSIRWFVPLLPLFVFFLFQYTRELTRIRMVFLSFILLISFAIACVGAIKPWSDRDTHASSIIANIMTMAGMQRQPVDCKVREFQGARVLDCRK